jgi:anti-sigma factor RsiW
VSCNSYDWKAYALGELNAADRRAAESHATSCPQCRQELAEARLTLDALSVLREEDPPRRIAFVSDKVFEPRWWHSFLRPSFAAGALIAAAILVHAFVRPAPVDDAAIQARINQAVARIEERQARQMEVVLSTVEMLEKQNRVMYVQNAGLIRQ